MKKPLLTLMCLAAMMMASMSIKAQEVTIMLKPGWTWISYPSADTVDFATALGTFTPRQGDVIACEYEYSEYYGGEWVGDIQQFYPGYGYMYYSSRSMPVFLTFNAQHPAPQVVVTTLEPTDITTNSATCGGNVASTSGDYVSVILRGICWGTNPNPTFNDNYIGAGNGLGSFTVSMTELTPGTTYYVRAFAVTPTGTFYGEEVSFGTENDSNVPTGAVNGMFCINEDGHQVYFSQGNLQYIGSASTPYWKFADNQWDVLGTTTGQNSSDQNVDRDLFGWATSGYNHGSNCYQPWSTSQTNSDYYAYGSYGFNLNDSTGMADWSYNPISNGGNQPNQWRTLTREEWDYIFDYRPTATGIRYAKANVNWVNGVILLPDDWDTSYYSFNNTNDGNASFYSNGITASEWNELEQYGAVFMPAAGYRNGTSVGYVGSRGFYSSASCSYYENNVYSMFFYESNLNSSSSSHYYYGQSVRPVCSPMQNTSYIVNVTANLMEGGSVSEGGTYQYGTECTLTATANNGYVFISWTWNGKLLSTDATFTFTVLGNRNIVANFGPISAGSYVDLGLPSGLLWATCNVGAETPEKYGDYFAWGETQPKEYYGWSTYQHCNGSSTSLTKYCGNPSYGYYGFTDNLITLLPEDDAATANWGTEWRMPTREEWEELYNNTTVTEIVQNGVNGCLFTASNGNSLFLPNAGSYGNYEEGGWMEKSKSVFLPDAGNSCYRGYGDGNMYWSSSLESANYPHYAYSFEPVIFSYTDNGNRPYGLPVRAVRSSTPTGAINGKFTINADGDQVYFSQGNLQYQASTNTWKFADNQYDYIGSTNSNISSTYSGWIDLFGWGTSGYNHGANCYQPWSTSTSYSDYYAYGNYQYNLYDQTGQADWGYNAISNGSNTANQWRTLTGPEWDYVFNTRATTSGIRYAKANVNNVNGVILLPDDWSTSTYSLSNTNSSGAGFGSNRLTASQWSTLEQAGAVFLPAAGFREGASVSNVGYYGCYWSASIGNLDIAASLYITSSSLYGIYYYRSDGRSVRLVRVAEN